MFVLLFKIVKWLGEILVKLLIDRELEKKQMEANTPKVVPSPVVAQPTQSVATPVSAGSILSLIKLQRIYPHMPVDKAQEYYDALIPALDYGRINTKLRIAAFLGEIGLESGELRFWVEEWIPTPQQLKYDPVSEVADRLGNTKVGMGKLYLGRGPVQLTGFYNYSKYGKLLGVDLVNNPDLAATPVIGFKIAVRYFMENNLNSLADAGNFTEITRRVNGGLTDLQARLNYYNTALRVL